MLFFLMRERPVESLVGIGTLAGGLLLYFWNSRLVADTSREAPEPGVD